MSSDCSVPQGIVCSPQDYKLSQHDQSIYCLARGDAIGLTVTIEAGLLSLLAIISVFLMIGRNVQWRVRHMSAARLRIFHQPMDLFIFSLLLADAIQAIGMLLNIKWVRDGKVEVGTFCTAQGIVKIFGATGVALSTLGIALYTFVGVWMMKGVVTSMRVTTFLVLGIWVLVAILAVVGLSTNNDPSKPNLIGPTPYWCWVNSHYLGWRLLGEYLWMWITLFLSLLVYVPLYLWMRGNIALQGRKWRLSLSAVQYPHTRARRRRSLVMLLYPLVYCISIMPLSITRWITFVQQARHDGAHHVPAAATFVGSSIFALSGFFNVILLVTTKPESGLFGQLMFVSPAQPPLIISDPYRDERSKDPEGGVQVGNLPSKADLTRTN